MDNMRNLMTRLADETIHTVHFLDCVERDRPAIKSKIIKTIKQKLKNRYGIEKDYAVIEKYVGDYVDDLATDIIQGRKVNEGTWRFRRNRRPLNENIFRSALEKYCDFVDWVAEGLTDKLDALGGFLGDKIERILRVVIPLDADTRRREEMIEKLQELMLDTIDNALKETTDELKTEIKQEANH